MEDEMLKVNILTITASGFLMLLTGLLLYIFKDIVSRNIRFFLPIPPIGVAAYIFVFNMFRYYNAELPGNFWDTLRELTVSAVISGIVFCSYSVLIVFLTYVFKGLP